MFQATGINRNIVECKVVTLLSIFYHRSVLIETLWNVKLSSAGYRAIQHSVLIETLWNVKMLIRDVIGVAFAVLIETLWNVKAVKLDEVFTLSHCINRNIVECKGFYSFWLKHIFLSVLIETLWNVKEY